MKSSVESVKPRWFSLETCEAYSSLSKTFWFNEVKAGRLKAYNPLRVDGEVVNRIVIEKEDLDEWMDKYKQQYYHEPHAKQKGNGTGLSG